MDDQKHDQVPDPPDEKHGLHTKLRIENLNNDIDYQLIKHYTGAGQMEVECMLVHGDQVPSSSWNAVLCSLLLRRGLKVDQTQDPQANHDACQHLGLYMELNYTVFRKWNLIADFSLYDVFVVILADQRPEHQPV